MRLIESTVLLILIWPSNVYLVSVGTRCPPLQIHRSVEISCIDVSSPKTSRKCTAAEEAGTTVKFKCKPYYAPFDGNDKHKTNVENVLKCSSSGTWVGLQKYEAYFCKEDCGRSTSNTKPLIIHGITSDRSQVPWHANIFKRSGNSWNYICGGSLIRSQVVLSAAHCFAFDHNRISPAEEFRVVLGSVSSRYSENSIENGIQSHRIQNIHISENYDPRKGFQSDIAVLQLKENVDFDENVVPVCLPNDYVTDINALKNGQTGKVAGYGVTEEGIISKTLKSLDIKIKSHSECQIALGRVLTESQFCAGNQNGTHWETGCNGDSGGGLVVSSLVHEKYYIHGIFSSGDPDIEDGVCKNYAIFTRIYPFIFWIRDVIEGISDEIARDLQQNPLYPYALRGTETQVVNFAGIPREWNDRITSLEIEHATLTMNSLLEALEHAKPIESILLKNVAITNWNTTSKRNVILPVLSSFTLDILTEEKQFDGISAERKFPIKINGKFLEYLLFFNKDFENADLSNVENLLNLNTDVEIIVNIFRLVKVKISTGELTLQQTDLVDKILEKYEENSEFTIRRLSLHRCVFDFSTLHKMKHLLELVLLDNKAVSTGSNAITTRNGVNYSHILKNMTELKVLIFEPPTNVKTSLDLNDLSKNLVHLSASNLHLTHKSNKTYFEKMETFCCSNCTIHVPNLRTIFPNLKAVVLRTNFLNSIPLDLEFARLHSVYVEVDDQEKIAAFLRENGIKFLENGKRIFLEKINSVWKVRTLEEFNVQHLLYFCKKQSRFWTSEVEYMAMHRLKSFEKEAWKTQAFKFVGTENRFGFEEFKGIPVAVQLRLKTISLKTTEISAPTLASTVEHCKLLESFTFTKVLGRHGRSVELSKRPWTYGQSGLDTQDISNRRYGRVGQQTVELRLEKIRFHDFTFEYVLEYVNGKLEAAEIPFQHIGRFKYNSTTNVLHRLFLNINSVRISTGNSILYVLDTTLAEVRNFQKFVLKLISTLPEEHVLRNLSKTLQERYALFEDDVLPQKWKFSGFHVLNQEVIKAFTKDFALDFVITSGIFDFLLTHLGEYVTFTRSSTLSIVYNQEKNPFRFPLIHAVALGLNENNIE